jgi:N-acetylglucosaminyl-diphospho-decaprenol L-rhamnosyltransferase
MPAADTVVIVVHYGQVETTRRCVESVRASDGADAAVLHIIVIDNGSPIPYSDAPGAARTRIIRSQANRGYAGAINLAMASLPPRQNPQTARGILLLNNDVVLDRRCLLALQASTRQDALLAPLLVDRLGGRPTDWGETVNTFTIHHRALACVPDEDAPVEFVTGAALFADEEVFRKIGPWDERFFLYGEDFDYCLRARRLGIDVRVVRSAVASHAKGAASGQGLNPFNAYYIHRNRVLLARKWHSVLGYSCFVPVYAAIVLLKIVKWSAVNPALGRALAAAFRDGVSGSASGRARPSSIGDPAALLVADRDGQSAPPGPTVSVIIVNFKSYAELDGCLGSLLPDWMGTCEVIVVDHATSAPELERVRAKFPQMRTAATPENPGLSAGINAGARLAAGRHLLIMNPDARVAGGAVEAMARYLDAHPEAAVVGPRVEDPGGAVQQSARRFPSVMTGLAGRTSGLTRAWPANPLSRRELLADASTAAPREVPWVAGSCLAVRADAFRSVGGMDERFFLYWEDADLCRRLRDAGWHVVYLPAAVAVHRVGRSRRHARARSIRAFHHSAYLYFAKHRAGGWRAMSLPIVGALLAGRMCAKLAIERVTRRVSPDR